MTSLVDGVGDVDDVGYVGDPTSGSGLPLIRRRQVGGRPSRADRVLTAWLWSGGSTVLVVMGAVGLFLLIRSFDALGVARLSFLTTSAWEPGAHHFGIAAVLVGTILIAAIAVSVSIPMALATAVTISQFAPGRLKQTLVTAIDLMAAIPSVVYGLWGAFYLQGHILSLSKWLSTWLGWIPLFRVDGADPDNPLSTTSIYTSSAFIAGVVVAMMVMPIQCAVMRETFDQTPLGEREGAYALGATRWGMITMVVLPFGRGGIVGGTMLGLGRALGETVAVYMIISPIFTINFHVLQNGTNSVSSLIANKFSESSDFSLSALMAAGLALFAMTLVVNFGASAIISRSRSGAVGE